MISGRIHFRKNNKLKRLFSTTFFTLKSFVRLEVGHAAVTAREKHCASPYNVNSVAQQFARTARAEHDKQVELPRSDPDKFMVGIF